MQNKRSYLIKQLMMTLKLHLNSQEEGLQMPNLMFLTKWKMLLDKKVISMLVKALTNILVNLILENKLQEWSAKCNKPSKNKNKPFSR